jgi:hypothetical protein
MPTKSPPILLPILVVITGALVLWAAWLPLQRLKVRSRPWSLRVSPW